MISDYFKLKHSRVLEFKNVTVDKHEYCKYGGPLSHEQFKAYVLS